MTIDLRKMQSDIFDQLNTVSTHDIVVTAGIVTTLFGAAYLYRRWWKRRGFRMVRRERMTKNKRLLADIINDGLFEAECAGKISTKEVSALYAEMAKKFDLHDLVPKKRLASIVKQELKANRNSKKLAGVRAHKPNIPGPKPDEITPKTKNFVERVGKFATSWRKVAA